jgi:thiamine transport system substrate-binding protein
MKRLFSVVLAVTLVFFTAACTKSEEPAQQPVQAQEVQKAEPDSIDVYAYDSFVSEWGPGPAIKEGFENATGIELNLHSIGDSGQVLQRAILEKDDPKADVIIGIDNNMLFQALEADILISYESPQLEHIDRALHFDPSFHVLPYDYGYFAMIYNEQMTDTVPSSLEDLTSEEYEKRIILMDPRTSSPGLGFLLWTVAAYGDDFTEYWERLKPSVLTVTDGWDTGYGLFTNGEAPLVLSYTTSPAYHVEYEEVYQFLPAMFDEGHYLQIEGAGILKGADNPDGAKLFMDYLLSTEAQEIIPLTNWMYPVRDDLELPASYAYAPKAGKVLNLDPEEIENNLELWVDQWLEVMSR